MGYLESILGQSEKIVFSTRKHWFVIWRALLVMIVFIILVVGAVGAAFVTLPPATAGLSFLGLIFLVFPIGRMIFVVLEWANEQYVVTNRRIIQIDGLFNKHVVDSSLEKVNDVVMYQSLWGRMWGYGDIEIMTASDIGVNKLVMLSRPVLFKTTMLNMKEAMSDPDIMHHQEASQPAAAPPGDDVPGLIAQLAGLRDKGILTPEEFEKKKAELMSRM
jgi:uncharacterized membrane protein YdbT with pleckstrin-like domain